VIQDTVGFATLLISKGEDRLHSCIRRGSSPWPLWWSPTAPNLNSEVIASRGSTGLARRGPICLSISSVSGSLWTSLKRVGSRREMRPIKAHEPSHRVVMARFMQRWRGVFDAQDKQPWFVQRFPGL